MLLNIGIEKPRELSMDYVAALPSQRYLYRGENCQLMMSRQFCIDSSATPVFQSAGPRPQAVPKVTASQRGGGGLSSLTSFVGNALTGMMTSLFGQKKMVIPPPFEYQLNEQHIRSVDFASYDKQKQKILTLFDPKLTPVSTPEPGLIFDTDTNDPFQRYMDTAQQVTPPKVVVVEPPVETEVKAASESVLEHKKRDKVPDVKPKADKSPKKSGVEPLLKPLHSPSSFRHSHQKVMNKNRKEKARHEIALSIREDLSDQDDAVDDEPLTQAVTTSGEHAEKTETTKQTVPLLTSVSDFPVISCPISESLQQRTPPKTNNNNNDHTSIASLPRSCSECEIDDNFIVFASDAASTTPESSYNRGSPKKSPSRCKSITDALRLKRFGGAFRPRQASECSEDSFVVFADDSEAPATKETEWSDEDDSDDDSESDSDDDVSYSETESESDGDTEEEEEENVPQMDSGFEEKKVSVNKVK
jgi:hypothetical protein